MNLQCLQCISEAISRVQKDSDLDFGEEVSKAREAVTIAPNWVSETIHGQLAYSCVAVPTCAEHLRVEDMTPEQIASKSGLAIGRDGRG